MVEEKRVLKDEELEIVAGGATVVGNWAPQTSTEEFFTEGSSLTESRTNFVIRKKVPKKPGGPGPLT